MASSKLMASSTSTSSRKSDHRRNPVSKIDPIIKPELRSFHHTQPTLNSDNQSNMNLDMSSNSLMTVDEFLKNVYAGEEESNSPAADVATTTENTLLNAEITLLDAAGAISPIVDDQVAHVQAPARKKTVDEVWREIVAGKMSEQRRVEPKEEAMDEMMTLEDFLVKAGAVDEVAVVEPVEAEVKLEAGSSGGMFSFDTPYMARQGSVDSGGTVGYGNGGVDIMGSGGTGRGKRRIASLLEPMDKAAQQRQRRMIKNRESAARSRERKQAYQVELEAMAVRLEEENEQLTKEKVERTKERHKLLMENVIPVVERRKPERKLRRICSATW